MWRSAIACAGVLAGCGGGAFVAVEPQDPGDLRIAVAIGGGQRVVQALPASDPFRPPLAPAFAAGGSLEVWIFRYSTAQLAEDFPALAGKSPAAAAAELGVSFDAPAAPEATLVLHASVSEGGPKDVLFERSTWAAWLAYGSAAGVPTFGFTTPRKVEPPRCPTFPLTRIASPVDFGLDHAAALSDTRLIAGGTDPDGDVFLIGVEGTRASRLPLRTALPGGLFGLARASDGTVYGLRRSEPAGESSLFHVSAAGVELPAPHLELGGEPRGLTAGSDGVVIAFGSNGVFDFTAGSTRARARNDVTPTVRFLAAASRTRMFAADARSLYYFDGQTWRREHTLGVLENVFAVAAGATTMVATGEGGITLQRDEPSGTWKSLPAPFGLGRLLRAAAALGPDRFAVAGTRGLIGVRVNDMWCPIDHQTDLAFHALAAAPSERVLFVLGGDTPPILRVELPE